MGKYRNQLMFGQKNKKRMKELKGKLKIVKQLKDEIDKQSIQQSTV